VNPADDPSPPPPPPPPPPGPFRRAWEGLQDRGREAVEGIEEQGRRIQRASLRTSWAIGLAFAACAVLFLGALFTLVGIDMWLNRCLDSTLAMFLTAVCALAIGWGGLLLSRRLIG
jgi:hypothetical protein